MLLRQGVLMAVYSWVTELGAGKEPTILPLPEFKDAELAPLPMPEPAATSSSALAMATSSLLPEPTPLRVDLPALGAPHITTSPMLAPALRAAPDHDDDDDAFGILGDDGVDDDDDDDVDGDEEYRDDDDPAEESEP